MPDETIIDASFFLYLQGNLPSTFGGVAKSLLSKIMNFSGNVIHYVTDKWLSPSIKDSEREGRNSNDQNYEIKGPKSKAAFKMDRRIEKPKFQSCTEPIIDRCLERRFLAFSLPRKNTVCKHR